MMLEHEKVAVAHLKAMKSQETSFRSEMMKQSQIHSNKVKELNQKILLLQKEKSKIYNKSEKYKNKCIKEHDVVKIMKQNIMKINNTNDNDRAKIINENNHLKTRLKEVEKSRDALLSGGDGITDEKDDQSDSIDNMSSDTARREEVANYMNKLKDLMK